MAVKSSSSLGQRPLSRGPKSGPASRRSTFSSDAAASLAATITPPTPPPTITVSACRGRSFRFTHPPNYHRVRSGPRWYPEHVPGETGQRQESKYETGGEVSLTARLDAFADI